MQMTADHLRLSAALMPVLRGTDWWDRRGEVEWYVSRCEMAGFCETDDMRRLCAQRFMAGKRKVTPPGHQRKKNAAKRARQEIKSPDLVAVVREACKTDAANQYRSGNEKALNALIGFVLKRQKAEPGAIKSLLIEALTQD